MKCVTGPKATMQLAAAGSRGDKKLVVCLTSYFTGVRIVNKVPVAVVRILRALENKPCSCDVCVQKGYML